VVSQTYIPVPPKASGRPTRVALVSFHSGEYCVRLASALAEDAEVLLMLPEEQAQIYSSLLDPKVTLLPFASCRLRQPFCQLSGLHRMREEIRKFSADVVHLYAGNFWFHLSSPWWRQPFVLTIHDTQLHPGDLPSQKTPEWAIEVAYRRADEIIAHAEFVKQSFLAKYPIGPERLHVIPHIKLGEEMVQTEVLEDNNTVLFFGRIWEYKGLEYLIRAEPLITAEVPGAKIVIAGQGEDFSRYRQMMVHPENFVVLNRYVSDADRDELFRRASVVALPYIEASQSGVVPVACTFSKPVVATTVGGLPEAVDDGATGFCVPPRDEKALAQAIVRLLKDPALRKCFGANANRKINTEGLPAIVAKSTLEVYRRAMARSAPKTLAL
jgi:glycosyltransferase involved in cell wall biosynthesis